MTACYLINRSPMVALNDKVQEKGWTKKDVYYSHLRTFGCIAYARVPKELTSKLDDQSIKCIILGYENNEFGYRLWGMIRNKIVSSRDVVFFEDRLFDDVDPSKLLKYN